MSRCADLVSSLASLLLLTVSSAAFSQSCTTPTQLWAQGSYPIDTCHSGDAGPVNLCSGLLSTGNAVFFRLYLQYPIGYVFSVAPDAGSNFDPAIVVRRHDCLGAGYCADVVDAMSVGQGEMFQLYQLDSGDYDIIVTSLDAGGSCGTATVTFSDGLCGCTSNDGIFVSKFDF